MITGYYRIEVQSPKNGKPGSLSVNQAHSGRIVVEDVVEADTPDTIGAKIAVALWRFGWTPAP
jgi:hypothetical protein